MIISDLKLAILRVLAGAAHPLTASEIADALPGFGRHTNGRGASYPAVSTVKANLAELRRNEGMTARPWVRQAGIGSRNATTWDITALGRDQLEALTERPDR